MFSIVPREAVETFGREFAQKPAGTGPFLLESMTGSGASLVRNPTFREERFGFAGDGTVPTQLKGFIGKPQPIADRVRIAFLGSPTTRFLAYSKGEVHFLPHPRESYNRLFDGQSHLRSEFADHHWETVYDFSIVYLAFNLEDPDVGIVPGDPQRTTKNRALRCAIERSIDWQQRREALHGGVGREFRGLIPPGLPEFEAIGNNRRPDFAAARALLEASGWTADELPTIKYAGVGGPRSRVFYELLRNWLMNIGFPKEKVTFDAYASFGSYTKAVRSGNTQLQEKGWIMDYPDVQNVLQLAHSANRTPGSNTSSNFADPRFDELFETAASMPPSAERTRLYREANDILQESCAILSGLARESIFVWSPDTVGLFGIKSAARLVARSSCGGRKAQNVWCGCFGEPVMESDQGPSNDPKLPRYRSDASLTVDQADRAAAYLRPLPCSQVGVWA